MTPTVKSWPSLIKTNGCENTMKELTQSHLQSLYDYNKDTGDFTRLVNMTWQAKKGQIAGHINTAQRIKYKSIRICGVLYQCHRLAWLYVYGEWPKFFIDHINGDGLDNRIANLRDVTNTQNIQASKRIPNHNTTGFKGVCKIKDGVYVAGISIGNKRKHLGLFKTPELASEAYQEAKKLEHFQ